MTDRTTDRPAGQTARNWFLIGCMAVDGEATLEQTKQFACYCPVLGSSEWLVIVSASATFCLCLFSLRRGGRGEIKSTITPQLNCIFIIFAKKKTRNPKKEWSVQTKELYWAVIKLFVICMELSFSGKSFSFLFFLNFYFTSKILLILQLGQNLPQKTIKLRWWKNGSTNSNCCNNKAKAIAAATASIVSWPRRHFMFHVPFLVETLRCRFSELCHCLESVHTCCT